MSRAWITENGLGFVKTSDEPKCAISDIIFTDLFIYIYILIIIYLFDN